MGISVVEVGKRFNGFTALDEVSLAIPEGSFARSSRNSRHQSTSLPRERAR